MLAFFQLERLNRDPVAEGGILMGTAEVKEEDSARHENAIYVRSGRFDGVG